MKKDLLLIFLFPLAAALPAQEDGIPLKNPSFERSPAHSAVTRDWTYCGPAQDLVFINTLTTADSLPAAVPAFDGASYVGLLCRKSGSWAAVSQHLARSLVGGRCYQFSFYARRSGGFRKTDPATGRPEAFPGPARIRAHAGLNFCNAGRLLGETPVVEREEWEKFTFHFRADYRYDYLTIQVFFESPSAPPYNGHVLLDAVSDLTPCSPEQAADPEHRAGEADRNGTPLPGEIEAGNLETIDLEAPQDLRDVQQLVSLHGRQVVFDPATQDLMREYYLDEEKLIRYQNPALHRIVYAMQSHPHIHLEIAVRSDDLNVFQKRRDALRLALNQLGMPRQKYRILNLNETMLTEDWLWNMPEADVLMRLVFR